MDLARAVDPAQAASSRDARGRTARPRCERLPQEDDMNAMGQVTNQEGRVLTYFLLWLLGVPASLLIIFYLLGVGR
jgi:hypothetical protein